MKTARLRVTLTPELQQFVEDKVRTGRYQDASEVIREALRVFERGADASEDPALETLIQEGLDSDPAMPLTRRVWDQIWAESDKLARRLGSKRKTAARRGKLTQMLPDNCGHSRYFELAHRQNEKQQSSGGSRT